MSLFTRTFPYAGLVTRYQSPWSLELWIGLSDHYQISTSYSRHSFRASGRRIFFSTNTFFFTTKKRQFF